VYNSSVECAVVILPWQKHSHGEAMISRVAAAVTEVIISMPCSMSIRHHPNASH
jgi:hypothetical protein